VPPFEELGVTYTVYLWLVGKRVVDFLLVLIEHFANSHGWGAMSGYWSKSWFSKGGGWSLWAQLSGTVAHQRLLASEN